MKKRDKCLIALALMVVGALGIRHVWLRVVFGEGARIVIRGKVLDPDTSVQAGRNQKYVATDQGWAAMKVQVRQVLKGDVTNKVVWLQNMAGPLDVRYGRRWTWDCSTSGDYFFALNPNSDLSKWCETDVFDIVSMSPDRKR